MSSPLPPHIGAVLTFPLVRTEDSRKRTRRLKNHWVALDVELEGCGEFAPQYIQTGVEAPSYRLPILASQSSFPALLSEGEVSRAEASALSRFFSQVQALNRGLDQAQTYRASQHTALSYKKSASEIA